MSQRHGIQIFLFKTPNISFKIIIIIINDNGNVNGNNKIFISTLKFTMRLQWEATTQLLRIQGN